MSIEGLITNKLIKKDEKQIDSSYAETLPSLESTQDQINQASTSAIKSNQVTFKKVYDIFLHHQYTKCKFDQKTAKTFAKNCLFRTPYEQGTKCRFCENCASWTYTISLLSLA